MFFSYKLSDLVLDILSDPYLIFFLRVESGYFRSGSNPDLQPGTLTLHRKTLHITDQNHAAVFDRLASFTDVRSINLKVGRVETVPAGPPGNKDQPTN